MSPISCVFCQSLMAAGPMPANSGGVSCPSCRRVNDVTVFPALVVAKGPPPLVFDPPGEGDAICFYNPGRRATKTCSHCGVMVSDSWAAQWGDDTVCLKCLEHLRDKSDDRFQSTRTLWDNVALAVACLPFTFVFWFVSFVSAPASVFLALWHWNSPRSMVPRSRLRLVLALLLGLAQISIMVLLVIKIWFKARTPF